MNKVILASLLGLFVSSVQAELPSICFDGTFAGGAECDVPVDGKRVSVGMEPDDFFRAEERLTDELAEIFKDLHDKISEE